MLRFYLSLFLLMIGIEGQFSQSLMGQSSEEERKQTFPISISLSNHSWAFPFDQAFRLNPVHPGIAIGTEFYYLKRPKSKLFQTAEIGGFLNKNQGSALYFNSNLTYRYTASFGLMAELGLGLGYFHGFHRSAVYEQTSNGEYQPVKDTGIPSSSSNLSFALGYDLSNKFEKNWMPFVRYQWMASTRYWSLLGIRPNGLLHLGVQLRFI